jgi:hypothetical protein
MSAGGHLRPERFTLRVTETPRRNMRASPSDRRANGDPKTRCRTCRPRVGSAGLRLFDTADLSSPRYTKAPPDVVAGLQAAPACPASPARQLSRQVGAARPEAARPDADRSSAADGCACVESCGRSAAIRNPDVAAGIVNEPRRAECRAPDAERASSPAAESRSVSASRPGGCFSRAAATRCRASRAPSAGESTAGATPLKEALKS